VGKSGLATWRVALTTREELMGDEEKIGTSSAAEDRSEEAEKHSKKAKKGKKGADSAAAEPGLDVDAEREGEDDEDTERESTAAHPDRAKAQQEEKREPKPEARPGAETTGGPGVAAGAKTTHPLRFERRVGKRRR
jgi:hypothetical protein